MSNAANERLFGPELWETALHKYAVATHLTVQLIGADGQALLGPVHPTPLFQLFEAKGTHPGLFEECARRCIARASN